MIVRKSDGDDGKDLIGYEMVNIDFKKVMTMGSSHVDFYH